MKMIRIHNAFTLIELLVVIAIIGILSSMIFATLSGSNEQSQIKDTELLIAKVSAALSQFENYTGAVAVPTGSQADAQSGAWAPATNDGVWDKQQLWWRLSSKVDATSQGAMNVYADAQDLAYDPYQSHDYQRQQNPTLSDVQLIPVKEAIMDTIPDADAINYKGTYTNAAWNTPTNVQVAGQNDVKTQYAEQFTYQGQTKKLLMKKAAIIQRDLAIRAYQTWPILEREDIGAEYIREYTIIDIWGNPLIYSAHSTVEVPFQRASRWIPAFIPVGAKLLGRHEVKDRNLDGAIDVSDWAVQPSAASIGDWDSSGTIDKNDWESILYNARIGNARGFFLASAGPDGQFNCLYAEEVNADNVLNVLRD